MARAAPQAAALVAALADPDRGWDAIVMASTSGRSTAASTHRWRRCSALWRPAVDAGGGWADRLWRRGSRAGDAGAGVQSGGRSPGSKDPGPYRDGGPDPRAGPLSGWPAAAVTGWRTRARTRTRPTPRGGGGRTGWSRTRSRADQCSGCSRSGWEGTALRGSARALNDGGIAVAPSAAAEAVPAPLRPGVVPLSAAG